jgi:hypothetical protein
MEGKLRTDNEKKLSEKEWMAPSVARPRPGASAEQWERKY